jgi:hypothetical protein
MVMSCTRAGVQAGSHDAAAGELVETLPGGSHCSLLRNLVSLQQYSIKTS